jgi:4-amino-4-deoxy-L-arabinose transferase-like glycosyltransferase
MQPFWRFATCWIIPGLVVLSLSTFKSRQYAAPLMPPLTIIGAIALLAWLQQLPRQPGRVHVMLAILGGAGAAVGVVAVQLLLPLPSTEKHLISGLILLLASGGVLTLFFLRQRNMNAGLTAVFGTAWLAVAVTFGWVMPYHDSYREQTRLAQRVNQAVPQGRTLHLLQMPANGENQITYYLTPPLKRIDDPAKFAAGLPAEESDVFVLAPVLAVAELERHGTLQELDTHPARPKQPENQRLVLFRLRRTFAVNHGQSLQ